MPLYEYQCESCGHRFEKIQKFSDPHVTECPKCGGRVKKLFSSPAIQFKGSGWYITDYAKKSSTEGTKAGGTKDKDKSDAGSTDTAKTDSSSKSGDASATSTSSDTSTKSDS